MNKIESIYFKLLEIHGPQGWWPLRGHYHKNNFDLPNTNLERFEIAIGAILTQNTSWKQVEKALKNLEKKNLLDPQKIVTVSDEILKESIKPAGYFNQKCKKLKIYSNFLVNLKDNTPTRDSLLDIYGIGPETADSILLYAYKTPTFVVDTYLRRIFSRLKIINENDSYNSIKKTFEDSLPKDVTIYQEYHALIVAHAKLFYSKKPYGEGCSF